MSGWIAALRIARREARRAKGRSALVLSLITLPVAALSFAAASIDMFTLTPAEQLDRELGAADALITWLGDGPVIQPAGGIEWTGGSEGEPLKQIDPSQLTDARLLSQLPLGSRVSPVGEATVTVVTRNGQGSAHALLLDVASPLTVGKVTLTQGSAPTGDDQVTVNEYAARWLGVKVGGTVRTVDPDRSFTVTGIVELADLSPLLVFPPGAITGTPGTWLVSTPDDLDWPAVQKLNRYGMTVRSRNVVLNPPADDGWPYDFSQGPANDQLAFGGLVGGVGVLEIVLLAGPAFAVGARRRSRDLALVAANGASPAHLRRIVLADGVVMGVGGAVIGVCLGIVAAVIARPLIEEHLTQTRAGGWRFYPQALAAIAALAVLTALLAAAVPAFVTARQNVVAALAGRRGTVRSRKRWIVLGLILVMAGIALGVFGAVQYTNNVIMLGVIVGELGLVLLTPAFIGLIARLGRWLPVAPRIALRDTARNRSSAAPAISAIMAAVAGAVAIGVFIGAEDQHRIDSYRYSLPYGYAAVGMPQALKPADFSTIEKALNDTLPAGKVSTYQAANDCDYEDPGKACAVVPVLPPELRCPYSGQDMNSEEARRDQRCYRMATAGVTWDLFDDGGTLPTFTDANPEQLASARQVLAQGGAVVTDPGYVVDGRITLALPRNGEQQAPLNPDKWRSITVPGYALDSEVVGFQFMYSPTLIAHTDAVLKPAGFVVATSRMPTDAEIEKLNAVLGSIGTDESRPYLIVERGPARFDDVGTLVLGAVAALIALGAAAVATGLAMADTRGDLGTLAAVGASPRVRRALSLSHAGTISVLGTLLGTLAGLGAAAAIIEALNRGSQEYISIPLPFLVPWLTLLLVFSVPLIAMLGAGMFTRSRLPIERRF